LLVVALAVASLTPSSGCAQAGRDSLAKGSAAYDVADYGVAARLLAAGLDPALVQRDSAWVAGLHKLAHSLLEMGKASAASTWLRWALRLEPGLKVDEVNFPPAVVAAFDSARAVARLPNLGDSLALTTWAWATSSAESQGALRLRPSPVPVSVLVEGMGALAPGQDRRLPAGTYTILASADGYFPARVVREVLPGPTTVLQFYLKELPAKNPGFIYVGATPWGTVYLDGQRIGYTTIAARSVRPGSHRLRIERVGYAAFDTTISVAPDERVRLGTVQLRKQVGGQ
jgi:hypothetical protein